MRLLSSSHSPSSSPSSPSIIYLFIVHSLTHRGLIEVLYCKNNKCKVDEWRLEKELGKRDVGIGEGGRRRRDEGIVGRQQ